MHRQGERSFPKVQGLPLGHELQHEGALPHHPPPATALSDQAAATSAVHSAIKARVAKARAERLESAIGADEDVVREHSSSSPATVQATRSLREVGQWLQGVGMGGREVCSLCFDVDDLCGKVGDNFNISQLHAAWQKEHDALPAAATRKFITPSETLCHRSGICVCRRTAQGLGRKLLWIEAEKLLKQQFRNKHDSQVLLGGEVVCFWYGVGKQDKQNHILVTSVPLQYARPWRPTFLRLRVLDEEMAPLEVWLQNCVEKQGNDELYVTCCLELDNNLPMFASPFQFTACLDPELRWLMVMGSLSKRPCPWPHSVGFVRVLLLGQAEAVCFWRGASELHRRLAEPQDDQDAKEEEQVMDGDEMNIDAKEADTDKDFFEDLASLQASSDSSSSSSSGSDSDSSSSSSSSTSSNKAKTQSSSSTSSKDATPKKKEEPSVDPDEEPAIVGGKRKPAESMAARKRIHTATEVFGVHRLVPRYVSGELAAYQLSCRCPGHDKCSKELSLQVGKGASTTRRLLKTWALLGMGMSTRDHHMHPDIKHLLLESLAAGHVLAEEELDTIAEVGQDDDVVHPLAPAQAPLQTQDENPLGQAAHDVPPGVHQAMVELVATGALPITSLQQRQRNRRCGGSAYGVPPALAAALQYGYISPNLAAPQGMKWVVNASSWRLVPRGG